MKKIIYLIYILIFIVSLTSCGKKDQVPPSVPYANLDGVLGFCKDDITKIEYKIPKMQEDIFVQADVDEIISKLNVVYIYNKDDINCDVLEPIACFYIYKENLVIRFDWFETKEICVQTEYGNYYSEEQVDLLSINEYNIDVMEANKLFELTQEKFIWNGSIEDEFKSNLIIVVLKHSDTFPKLELRHFGLGIGEVEYVGGHLPPDYFYQEEYKEQLNSYKQIVYIYFEQCSKERIIELIRYLEQIDFIYYVGPNNIVTGA